MGRKKGFPKSVRAPKRGIRKYSPPEPSSPEIILPPFRLPLRYLPEYRRPDRPASPVLEITELLEKILMSLPVIPVDDSEDPDPPGSPRAFRPQIQLFALQRVNRMFCATIRGSKSLQEAMTVPPLNTRKRKRQYLTETAAEYGIGFARAIKSAFQCQSFENSESWCRIKYNRNPVKPLYVFSSKRVRVRTDADTTWGEIMDWHHTGVLARCTADA